MIARFFFGAVAAAALWGWVPAASAQTPQDVPAHPDFAKVMQIPSTVIDGLLSADTKEKAVSAALYRTVNVETDRRGLTPEVAARQADRLLEETQDNTIRYISRFDLDKDGVVTLAEVTTVQTEKAAKQKNPKAFLADSLESLMQHDLNSDGQITAEEMKAYRTPGMTARLDDQKDDLKLWLTLDPNNDGTLSVDEIALYTEYAFTVVDLDRDGKLSDDEKNLLKKQAAHARHAKRDNRVRERCALPVKPAADDKVVFISPLMMGTISSINLSGSMSEVTYVFNVDVSEITEPHYLVLLSRSPMIWDIKGASDKLTHVLVYGREERMSSIMGEVTYSGSMLAGVHGVAPNKITFMPALTCMPAFRDVTAREDRGKKAQASLSQYLGRAPNGFFELERMRAAIINDAGLSPQKALTHADLNTPPAGYDADVWETTVSFAGAGLQLFKKEDVISPATLQESAILPANYGFASLIHKGYFEKVSVDKHTPTLGTWGHINKIMTVRAKKNIPEWPFVWLGLNRILVPEGIEVPEKWQTFKCKDDGSFFKKETVYSSKC